MHYNDCTGTPGRVPGTQAFLGMHMNMHMHTGTRVPPRYLGTRVPTICTGTPAATVGVTVTGHVTSSPKHASGKSSKE